MARVFLSYAREDTAAAKQLAAGIDRAGHQVWWDHQIQGGTRFAAEIDRELKNPDVVVVLWTKTSVESPWVQDEAAEGRDAGRLLPNGHLEIQGRVAFMIKLRGYSIVPGAVESTMAGHPAVGADGRPGRSPR